MTRKPLRGPRHAGHTLIETVVVLSMVGVLLSGAVTGWRGYTARQRIRHAAVQVAADMRQAQERARSERREYRLTFTAASRDYSITRTNPGFVENTTLPDGVVPSAGAVVIFSPYGRPDAVHTITLQSGAGTATVQVKAMGSITYQFP